MAVRHVPAEFESIQEAVNASGPGDTIRVAGGIYEESVTIGEDKARLAVIGSGRENVILRGTGTGVGFTISGSDLVTIASLTVTGFETGIQIATDDNIIRDVTVTRNSGSAIVIGPQGNRNLVYRVVASQNGGDGMLVQGASNYAIHSEFADNGDDGLDFDGTLNVALGNRIAGNANRGLEVQGDFTLIVRNRVVGNQIGIGSTATQHLIYDNFVSRNRTVGVLLQNSINTLVLGNEVTCNLEEGLSFNGGAGLRVIRNKVELNGHEGIELSGSASGTVVDDNEVKENGLAGIRLGENATMNAVRRNKLKRNNPDIEVLAPDTAGNVVDENRCDTSRPPRLCRC